MKKILFCALFMAMFGGNIYAHPIEVTLSNGTKVILESDDYQTMDDLMNKISSLEAEIEEQNQKLD